MGIPIGRLCEFFRAINLSRKYDVPLICEGGKLKSVTTSTDNTVGIVVECPYEGEEFKVTILEANLYKLLKQFKKCNDECEITEEIRGNKTYLKIHGNYLRLKVPCSSEFTPPPKAIFDVLDTLHKTGGVVEINKNELKNIVTTAKYIDAFAIKLYRGEDGMLAIKTVDSSLDYEIECITSAELDKNVSACVLPKKLLEILKNCTSKEITLYLNHAEYPMEVEDCIDGLTKRFLIAPVIVE